MKQRQAGQLALTQFSFSLKRWGGAMVLGLEVSLGGLGLVGTGPSAVAQTQTPQRSPEPIQVSNTLRPLLRQGSEGGPVRTVQAMLSLLGFYSGPVDGLFGESTAIAVANFQQAADLEADGVVGPSTWSRLLPSPQQSSTSSPAGGSSPAQSNPATFPSPTPAPGGSGQSSAPRSGEASGASEDASSPATPQAPVTLPVLRRGMRGPAVVSLQERLRAFGTFSGTADGVFGPQTEAAVMAAQRRLNLAPDGVVGPETWSALLR